MAIDWNTLTTWFDRLVNSPVEARPSLLAEIKAKQPELYEELLSLLEEEKALHPVFSEVPDQAWHGFQDQHLVGEQVGAFRLTELIGEGGMGTVFLGQRVDGEFDQRVAIKLMRPTRLDQVGIERFRQERQILAKLVHPHIARLYDGGISKTGRPYFTMEWVSGKPITDYVSVQQLDLSGALRLFLQVCDAVSYAHQKLVIHLDLKPGNILVDSEGQAKLLDFGISWINDQLGEAAQTSPYTIAYAAPEQYRGAEVSTRTDVYALGLIMYELLVGMHPFLHNLKTAGDRRSFRDQHRIGAPSLFDGVPPARARKLKGDLDAICLKALAKNPQDRYASVETLAEDLRAWFDSRPISLRSDDRLYRLAKSIQRHRTASTVGALALLVLISIIGYFLVELSHERDNALQEAARAEQIKELTLNIFRQANPAEAQRSGLTAKEILDHSKNTLGKSLSSRPELLPEMYRVIGEAYLNLELFDEARQSMNMGLAVCDSIFEPNAKARIELLLGLASVYGYEFVDLETADSLGDLAYQLLLAQKRPDPRLEADALLRLGTGAYDQRRFTTSDSLFRLAIDRYNDLEGDQTEQLAYCVHMRGTSLRKLEKWKEAESLLLQAKSLFEEVHMPPHVDLAWNLNHLASLYLNMNELEKAATYAYEAWLQRVDIFGAAHMETIASQSNLGRIYSRMDRHEDALKYYLGAYDNMLQSLGPRHPYVAAQMNNLANTLAKLDRHEEAEDWYLKAISLQEEILPPESYRHTFALFSYGKLLLDTQRPEKAKPLLEEALSIREGELGREHSQVAMVQLALGDCLWKLDEFDRAKTLLVQAEATFSKDSSIHQQELRQVRNFLNNAQ